MSRNAAWRVTGIGALIVLVFVLTALPGGLVVLTARHATSPSPTMEAPAAVVNEPAVVQDAYGQRYWKDPSIDPETLARLYAPPAELLPRDAQPRYTPTDPSPRQWRELQRWDHAAAE